MSEKAKMQDDRAGAVQRVYRGVLADLEHGRMVPGQRLIETELADRFEVGRNAVREAIQRLVARGVVDLAWRRSPAIRRFNRQETLDVLDVAEWMTALTLRTAAMQFQQSLHASALDHALALLEDAERDGEQGMFSQARRNLYRIFLEIGANHELKRLFPAIGMHIIYAQYQSARLRGIRVADYRRMIAAVQDGDADLATCIASEHVNNVRTSIQAEWNAEGSGQGAATQRPAINLYGPITDLTSLRTRSS